jgi:hypothetical protein
MPNGEARDRADSRAIVAVGKEIVRFRHDRAALRPERDGRRGARAARRRTKRRSDRRLRESGGRLGALPRARSRVVLSLRSSIMVISGQLGEFASCFDQPLR